MNNNIQNNKNITDIPSELKDFNWAAFLLTFIWGFKYNAWITFLAIPLIIFQMPLGFNWFLLAILQLYCGFKGNEWAYKKNYWMKSKDFRISDTSPNTRITWKRRTPSSSPWMVWRKWQRIFPSTMRICRTRPWSALSLRHWIVASSTSIPSLLPSPAASKTWKLSWMPTRETL